MTLSYRRFLLGLIASLAISSYGGVVRVPPGAGGNGIQRALDEGKASAEVVLEAGTYDIRYPIILRKDRQILRGAGAQTILALADNANCPVIVVGQPIYGVKQLTVRQQVRDLVIDGNRAHQQREGWITLSNGSPLNNSGIVVMNTRQTLIDNVICKSCRSGGLVTSDEARQLSVSGLTAYDNQFDGLSCCETREGHFSRLVLHDNLGAGLSLDLHIRGNVFDTAVMSNNDVGIFMRHSHDNEFRNITIVQSHHDGVFMAQAGTRPHSECAGNIFKNLRVVDSGGRGFQVNDLSCTNNLISGGEFIGNKQGSLGVQGTNQLATRNVSMSDVTASETNQISTAPPR